MSRFDVFKMIMIKKGLSILMAFVGTLALHISFVNGGIFEHIIKNIQKGDKAVGLDVKAYANFCVAIDMMLESNWGMAVKYLNKTLETDPDSDKVHLYLATCYFQLNQKEQAIAHMKEAARIRPYDFNIHYHLANFLEAEGKLDMAISEYEMAIGCELKDDNKVFFADALLKASALYKKRGDMDRAISCLNEIIRLNMTNEPVKIYCEVAELYYKNNDITNACNTFERLKDMNPSLVQAHFYLAICYERLGKLDEAVAEAKICLEHSSDSWVMHLVLYRMYDKTDKKMLANEHHQKAFQILKNNVNSGSEDQMEYITMGQILLEMGKKEEALAILRNGLLFVDDKIAKRDIHFTLANICYELDKDDGVISELKEALKMDGDLHQANNFLGYFYAERGFNIDEAIVLIQKALKAEPRNDAYIDSLGWAYYKKAGMDGQDGLIKLALERLTEAANMSKDPEVREHIGDVYYSLGRWEDAEKKWVEALKLSNDVGNGVTVSKRLKEKVEKLNNLRFFEDMDKRALSNQRDLQPLAIEERSTR